MQNRILILGYLDNIATQEEINEYYYENLDEEVVKKQKNIFEKDNKSDIESDRMI